MSRIERWTRQLLEAEGRKRGIRDPEVRSRSELLWAIAQHDYGARQSLRNARKIVGSLIQGATAALPLFARRGAAQPATLPRPDAADAWQNADARHVADSAAQRDASVDSFGALQPGAAAQDTEAGRRDAELPADNARADNGAAYSVSNGKPSASPQLGAAARASRLQLRRADGQLELTWQVDEQDAQRARALLGQHGELSLRIVCVQADATHVVRSSVTEHGPLDASGAWTWVLPGPESHCVGSIGVRYGDRFVSIAHQSSRVPLGSGI